jgi:hypothetical protein
VHRVSDYCSVENLFSHSLIVEWEGAVRSAGPLCTVGRQTFWYGQSRKAWSLGSTCKCCIMFPALGSKLMVPMGQQSPCKVAGALGLLVQGCRFPGNFWSLGSGSWCRGGCGTQGSLYVLGSVNYHGAWSSRTTELSRVGDQEC